jgi:hypothetical protein
VQERAMCRISICQIPLAATRISLSIIYTSEADGKRRCAGICIANKVPLLMSAFMSGNQGFIYLCLLLMAARSVMREVDRMGQI